MWTGSNTRIGDPEFLTTFSNSRTADTRAQITGGVKNDSEDSSKHTIGRDYTAIRKLSHMLGNVSLAYYISLELSYITTTNIFEYVKLFEQYGKDDNSRRIWGPTSQYPEVLSNTKSQINHKYCTYGRYQRRVWRFKGTQSHKLIPVILTCLPLVKTNHPLVNVYICAQPNKTNPQQKKNKYQSNNPDSHRWSLGHTEDRNCWN